MTPLGKMLAIFVFLIALVWAWLTVNTFVSRTNWKAEAEKYQKQAEATAAAAESIKREVEAERIATKARILAAESDRKSSLDTVVALRKDLEDLKVQIDKKLSEAAEANPKINQDNSRIKELQTEVANLTSAVKLAQDKEVELTKSTALAKQLQEQAQRDAAAEKQRAASLENQLRTTDDKLKEAIARAKQGVGEGVAIRPTAPEGFRGTIKAVSKTGEFVEITPGGNTGLRAGTRLAVKRFDPKDTRFVGHITVRDEIDPDKAAAQFEPLVKGKVLTAADYPKPGDTVEPESK